MSHKNNNKKKEKSAESHVPLRVLDGQGEKEKDRIINTTATTITMSITMFFIHIDDR